jgi:uncharacterized protein YegL
MLSNSITGKENHMSLDSVSFADNPEPRCPVVLLVDVSSSMSKEGRVEALNRGMQQFCEQVKEDELAALRVEVCLITFGSDVEVVHDFATISEFTPPRLRALGTTAMGAAIEKGLDLLEARKGAYKENGILYYRPWVFLITDGAPTDPWQEAAARVHEGEKHKKFLFYAVGVSGSDFKTLTKISPPERTPLRLRGMQFAEMFQWLSASVKAVSASTIDAGGVQTLPPVSGWGEAPTL